MYYKVFAFKENQNAPRPSEHPPVRRKNVGLQINTKPLHSWHLKTLTVVTLDQQYNIGERPTVILYAYIINRHAGTPEKQ